MTQTSLGHQAATEATPPPQQTEAETRKPDIDGSGLRRHLRTLSAKWPQYLAEVLVIMVSILGAFALDRWNERRSREREQIALLRTALSELQTDLADIDFNVRTHRDAIRSMDVILAALQGDGAYHDSLAAHFHAALTMPRFVHSTSAFETMQSRGLDLVSDEELRRQLIRVYGADYANYRNAEAELASEITHGLRSVMPGRFTQGYNFDQIGRSYHGTMAPTDFKALKQDREYLYYLRTLRNRTNVHVEFFYGGLRTGVTRLRDLVDAEVRRLSG